MVLNFLLDIISQRKIPHYLIDPNVRIDYGKLRLDIWKLSNLLGNMAYRGEWQAVFDFLAEEIKQQTSIRDYLNGEKVIQGFLLAYLNVTHLFPVVVRKRDGWGIC